MGMIAGSREHGSFDLEAVLRGALWGFLFIAGVAVAIAFLVPVYSPLEQFIYLHDDAIRWGIYVLAALLSGVVAGARAGTMGLLHGALAALGSFLLLALASGILSGVPNLFDFGLRVAVNLAVGGLGGIMGVNLSD
jgi:putative membrane protein (TIGR04086 family)